MKPSNSSHMFSAHSRHHHDSTFLPSPRFSLARAPNFSFPDQGYCGRSGIRWLKGLISSKLLARSTLTRYVLGCEAWSAAGQNGCRHVVMLESSLVSGMIWSVKVQSSSVDASVRSATSVRGQAYRYPHIPPDLAYEFVIYHPLF